MEGEGGGSEALGVAFVTLVEGSGVVLPLVEVGDEVGAVVVAVGSGDGVEVVHLIEQTAGVKAELEDVAVVHPADGIGDLVAEFIGQGETGLGGGGSKGEAGGADQHGDGGCKAAGTGRFAGDIGLRQLEFEVANPSVAQFVVEGVAEG